MADISTPTTSRKIADFTESNITDFRDRLRISDSPLNPDKTYVVFDAQAGNNNLHIDTGSSSTYSILIGDGSEALSYTDTGGVKVINYLTEGRYLITISGVFNGISVSGATGADKLKYSKITGGSNYPLIIPANAFDGCDELREVVFLAVATISANSFLNCSKLQFATFPEADSVQSNSFDGCSRLIVLITKSGIDEFKMKSNLNIFGSDILTSAKTGANHLLNVALNDGYTYTAIGDGTIFFSDTVEDLNGSVFDVVIKGDQYIPAYRRYKIQISGTDAIVNTDISTEFLDGTFMSKFGSNGTGGGQFIIPTSVEVGGTSVFVGDASRDDVQKFDLNGNFTGNFTPAIGVFSVIISMATTNNKLYVLDQGEFKVFVFDFNGVYAGVFGSEGSNDGQFQYPRSVAVNETHAYVCDSVRDDVQKFELATNSFVSKFGSEGLGDGQFKIPSAIAIGGTRVFVGDISRGDVQIFDLNGTFVSKFGSSGTGDGQFQNIQEISVSETNIYVLDSIRADVQIFDLNGVFISKFGGDGTEDGRFKSASSIAVKSNVIYVVDETRYDVQKFK